MPDSEKQEGQKTVVAFIAGLLIGGLLVWVFSSSPENSEVNVQPATNTSGANVTTGTTNGSTNTTGSKTTTTSSEGSTQTTSTNDTTMSQPDIIRDGKIAVNDQPAGSVVVLSSVVYPTNAGWVVVRDLIDGTPGNILGAARYNETDGLTPESVSLLRATEAGKTYQVVFYSENGDKVFDLNDDHEIQGPSASFTAQ